MCYCNKVNEIRQYEKTGGTTEIPQNSKFISDGKTYCYIGDKWVEYELSKILDIWV